MNIKLLEMNNKMEAQHDADISPISTQSIKIAHFLQIRNSSFKSLTNLKLFWNCCEILMIYKEVRMDETIFTWHQLWNISSGSAQFAKIKTTFSDRNAS